MMKGMTKTFEVMGDRLRELRKRRELSQTELADLVNKTRFQPDIKQSRISDLERLKGVELPSVPVLAALAEALDTSTDYLLGLTDDEAPHGDMEDQVVLTVESEKRRTEMYEMMLILKAMSDFDFALVKQMVMRMQRVQIEIGKEGDPEWMQLWDTALTVGGAPFVLQMQRSLGVRMPKQIRAKLENAGLL